MELFKMFGEVALKGGEAVVKRLKAIDQAAERTNDKIVDIRDYINIKVDADTKKAVRDLERVEDKVEDIPRKKDVRIGANTSPFTGAIMALSPAIAPVLASAVGAIGGLTAAFAAAGAGAAAFGAIAIPALNGIFEASKEVEKIQKKIAEADTVKERKEAMKELASVYGSLTAKERAALKALQDFKSFWDRFVTSLQNPILDMFIQGLTTLKTVLNQLKPVFEASIKAFGDLFAGVDKSLKSGEMKPFFDWLAKNIGPTIKNFGTIFSNVMRGILTLIMAFGPVGQDMQNGLVGLSKAFADWAGEFVKSQAFKDFVDYIRANGPKLLEIIGQLGEFLMRLLISMAPLAPTILDLADKFLTFMNNLLQAHPSLGPIIVLLVQLAGIIKMLIPPILSLIGAIGWEGLAAALSSLAGPVGWVIAGIIALIGVLILVWNRSEAFRQLMSQLWTGLAPMIKSAWEGIKSIISGALDVIIGTIDFWANILTGNWKGAWNAVKTVAQGLWKILVGLFKASFIGQIVAAITAFGPKIKSTWNNIWNNVKTLASTAWNGIKTLVKNGIQSAYTTITGYASKFLSAGKSLLDSLKQGIKNGLSGALQAVKDGMAEIRSYLPFSPAKEGPLSDLDKSGESFFPTFASKMDRGLKPLLDAVSNGLGATEGLLSPGGGLAVRPSAVATTGTTRILEPSPLAPLAINFYGPVYMRDREEMREWAQMVNEEQYNLQVRLARARGLRR